MTDSKTDDTEHDGPVAEIDAATFERFEEERQKTKTEHAPAMDPSTFLSALLDTNEAVKNGYYERSIETDTEEMTDSGGQADGTLGRKTILRQPKTQ